MRINFLSLVAILSFMSLFSGCGEENKNSSANDATSESKFREAVFYKETFDFGWKFAKFGKHEDCLAKQEPGKENFAGTASSQENHNPAPNAFDGDKTTRWCANGGEPATLSVDFGQDVEATSTKILWEKNKNYRYKISLSDDAKTWRLAVDKSNKTSSAKENNETLSGKFRYAKIDVTPVPGAWASIFEWEFFDTAGTPVKPLTTRDGVPPYEVAFDDSAWRSLDLPHDWGVESKFLSSEPNQTGSLPWNAIGWYRKEFFVPADKSNRKFFIDFDGVMMTPQVYVNGKFAGEWKYGYNSFRIDITPFLKFGGENIIAVRAENKTNSTRWYPGAGIYRHTWLVETNPVYIDNWGVFVMTPQIKNIKKIGNKYYANEVVLRVPVTIKNDSDKDATVRIERDIIFNNKIIWSSRSNTTTVSEFNIAAGTKGVSNVRNTAGTKIELKSDEENAFELWDIENPALYTLVTTLTINGEDVDRQATAFGIRKAEWKPNGFYLNNRRVQIKGVCQHHDLGPLGGAVHEKAIERQIEILKSFGVNSIRTSHNPPAPELLALCDKMGILVDAELFDCWKFLKEGKANGYNLFWDEWRERDVRNFVMRDRNHPSIIAWSTGNEMEEQGAKDGVAIARDLVMLFKKYDRTRAITVGCNDLRASWNGFGAEFDVYGFNYKPNSYSFFANETPGKPFIGSETASCVSTRGFYSFPVDDKEWDAFWKRNFCDNLAACQVSSYDLYAPGWAYAPDVEFGALENEPRCAGEYVWSGFDYLGEPTPWNLGRKPANDFRGASPQEVKRLQAEFAEILKKGSPSRSSYFGIVDLCGFRKDRAYLYQSHWLSDIPMAHILPHWNWKGVRDGKTTPVFVYTSGDSAELFLNGKSLGKRTKKKGAKLSGKDMNGDLRERFRLTWMDVKYTPGTLKVVAYKNGKKWAEDVVETTDVPAKMDVTIDCNKESATLLGDGRDLLYYKIAIVDSKGRMVPTADNALKFSVSGPVEIVGVCNGNPVDHDSMKGDSICAFNGLAQVIVRSKRNSSGKAVLKISAGELPEENIQITVEAPSPIDLRYNR